MRQKHEYVRDKALLKSVRQLACQHCGADDGTVVAAHTNWGGGKGRGIKADDDLIAALCYRCHFAIDQGSHLSRAERQELWNNAHRRTKEALKCLSQNAMTGGIGVAKAHLPLKQRLKQLPALLMPPAIKIKEKT